MKISRLVLFGVLMTAFSVSSAHALPTVTVSWGQYHSWGGGEFILDTAIGKFNSFCVEENEYISIGETYEYTLSTGAINGGFGGGNPDPISRGTAWLFSQFANGTLELSPSHKYDTNNLADQRSLQEALWMLENEMAWDQLSVPTTNAWLNLAMNVLGLNQAGLQADAKTNELYGVQVMNLWDGTNPKQSQLVMIPDGGTTLTLLGLAFGGMALFSRRVRRA